MVLVNMGQNLKDVDEGLPLNGVSLNENNTRHIYSDLHLHCSVANCSCQNKHKPPRELHKVLLSFILLAVSGLLNLFILTIIHDHTPDTPPLPDLIFIFIPQQSWARVTNEVLTMICLVLCISLVSLHRYKWVIFIRAFYLASVLYVLRSVCLTVTFLPPSFQQADRVCQSKGNFSDVSEIFSRFGSYLLTLGSTTDGDGKILCGDLLFSGHTASVTLNYSIFMHYSPPKLKLLRYIITPIYWMALVTVVISGGHYTVDMVIAYWLTTHLFWGYHAYFESSFGGTQLSHLWWVYPSKWFEANVPRRQLRNHLQWPLKYPKCFVTFLDSLNS